jgi:Ca2+-binding RTX toxin-like protein
MLRASRDPDAEAGFIDQRNEVPDWLIRSDISVRTTVCFDGYNNDQNFTGTNFNDVVWDTRLRNANTAESATSNSFDGLAGNDLINAGKGDDTLMGGDGNDSLAGGMDEDHLWGGAGDDFLFGGSENDHLSGDAGDDVLEGGTGDDTLMGAQDNDVLRGGGGRDVLWGGDGNDRMGGGAGNDTVHGERGNDRIYGEEGDDLMRGGAGRDTLWGGDGNDTLDGGSWNDRLYAQVGDDTLIGGQGRDTLQGGDGDDWINGGSDGDRAWGGTGADEFAFNDSHIAVWDALDGTWEDRARLLDRIEDFEAGIDTIRLSGFTGTSSIGDLRGADFEMDGTSYTLLILAATNHRLLVHVENGDGWSALNAADNFDFG